MPDMMKDCPKMDRGMCTMMKSDDGSMNSARPANRPAAPKGDAMRGERLCLSRI